MIVTLLIIYNILIVAGLVLGLPVILVFKPSYLKHVSERLGMLPHRENCIWVHAASVGEIKASVPLLKRIIASGYNVHLTTVTPAGRQFASTLDIQDLSVSYAPADSILFTWHAMRRIKPKALIILETEIWPDLIVSASASHAEIASINARLTEKALKGYLYVRPLMTFLLKRFNLICVQTADDMKRFIKLGAIPGNIYITGNIKYAVTQGIPSAPVKHMKEMFSGRHIIIAGSTHSGEEQIVCDCFVSLKKYFASPLLILAPRHLNRISEVEEILKRSGLTYLKRSLIDSGSAKDHIDVVLLDTIGELADVYSIGNAIFIGGSMVPVGGHNIIEAAIYKKPVIYGKYVDSIKEFVSLLDGNGGIMVSDESELCSAIKDILEHPDKTGALGKKAFDIISRKVETVNNVIGIMKKAGVL